MTIEPSTVILTVISFCAFMAALNHILFKPVLKLMHERREKTEKGFSTKILSAEKLEEQNRLIISSLEEAQKNEREEAARRIKEAESEAASAKLRFQEEENERLEQIKRLLAAEQEKMEKEFESRLPEFAGTLANRLVSKDY